MELYKQSCYWLPWRFRDNSHVSHFEDCGFLQLIFFTWIFPVVRKGLKKSLELEDFGNLTENLKADVLLKRLNHILPKEKERLKDMGKVSLLKVYLLFSWKKLTVSMCINIIGLSGEFVTILMIRRFIMLLESDSGEMTNGFITVAVIFLTFWIRTINRNLGHFLNYRAGLHAKTAFAALIYQKAMKLKNSSNQSVGELVNLIANDTGRIFEASIYIVNLICLPFVILFYLGYLVQLFGPTSFVGCGILMLNMPVQLLSGKLFSVLRGRAAKISDQRIKMISEALTYVKLIKMYAWEKSFAKLIYNFREMEKKCIRQMAFAQGFTFSFGHVIGFAAPLATIATAFYVGKKLTVPETLTLLAVFKVLGFYGTVGPMGMKSLAEMFVSFRRIKKLLIMEEHYGTTPVADDSEVVLSVRNTSFAWNTTEENPEQTEEEPHDEGESYNDVEIKFLPAEILLTKTSSNVNKKKSFVLSNLNLEAKEGELVGICGSVGCGKSSFLQAIMGELEVVSGEFSITGSLAYVPQQAWIFNDTIRENVLLGKDYEEKLYKNVCISCSLDEDFGCFPSGDLTEIGERGINLSGGQKQRISLARAMYSQKKLYLLDDPLSAVDSHVGRSIFNNCIKNGLKGSAVIFVTHQLQYLKDCDRIIYVENGQFTEQGTYQEVMKMNGKIAWNIRNFHSEEDNNKCEIQLQTSMEVCSDDVRKEESKENIDQDVIEKNLQEKGRLIDEEDKNKGVVLIGTYKDFCMFVGGVFPVLLIILMIFGSVAMDMCSQYWLSEWLDVETFQQSSNNTVNGTNTSPVQNLPFMQIYCALILGALFLTVLSTITVVHFVLHGSTKLHNAVFKVIFQSSMEFFDTIPTGRIVNRLAKDVDEIDNHLPLLLENGLRMLAMVLGNLLLVGLVVPYILIPYLPLLTVLFFLNKGFRKVVRETKRAENVSRSFVYSHLAASMQGASSIKAYKKQQHFTMKFEKYMNDSTLSLYCFFSTTRWFSTYTDFCCQLVSLATCIAVLLLRESIPASLAGLCVIQGLGLVGVVPFVYRQLAEAETKFTSVERLNHYIKTLTPEGDFETKDRQLLSNWPQNGSVAFENVSLRYRENLPLVLKDMSWTIADKEKIGIVGRTGAGKSSIMVALYRLVNPTNGSIRIDGVDTRSIGLTDLRNELTIIPQDPVLFLGTIRYNLDPFHQYEEEALWNALEKAHIKDLVSNFELKLETEVLENGSNFSVGQRQLLCMARALLRNKKILLLDEATAAIDSETDQKIQATIQEAFQDCTVLTIAHRLNTVMHCDKILVLEKGQVVEYDTPANLLASASCFNEMVNAANVLLKS